VNVTDPNRSFAEVAAFSAEAQSDRRAAWSEIEGLRWPDGIYCPKCGFTDKVWEFRSRGSRGDEAGPAQARGGARMWKCGLCRQRFTVTVGTVLEDTKLAPELWLKVMTVLCREPKGLSYTQLAVAVGVSVRTARAIADRVFTARACEPLFSLWRGAIRRYPVPEGVPGDRVRIWLDELRAIRPVRRPEQGERAPAGKLLTLWPLAPREAMKALLQAPPRSEAHWMEAGRRSKKG
jgi:transposase-like protein